MVVNGGWGADMSEWEESVLAATRVTLGRLLIFSALGSTPAKWREDRVVVSTVSASQSVPSF